MGNDNFPLVISMVFCKKLLPCIGCGLGANLSFRTLWCHCGSQGTLVSLVFMVDLVPVVRVGNKERHIYCHEKGRHHSFLKSGRGGKDDVILSVGNRLWNKAQEFIHSLSSGSLSHSHRKLGESHGKQK